MAPQYQVVEKQCDEVLRVLRSLGGWRSTRTVADGVPWSVHTVWDRLDRLMQAGAVDGRRSGRAAVWRAMYGQGRLTPSPSPCPSEGEE